MNQKARLATFAKDGMLEDGRRRLNCSSIASQARILVMSALIHCVQLQSVWEDKPANFNRVRSLLQTLAPSPGGWIVLSEMFATGFSHNVSVTAEPSDGETRQFLSEIAHEWQCLVLGGLVTQGPDGRGWNQAVAIAPDGRELARYSKQNLFQLGGEGEAHLVGKESCVFEWQGFRVAPLICYDLRFPEVARDAVRQGAEVLVYQAAWPARRIQHWLTLLQARAIENQAYVIGVNRCGQEPTAHYCGRSVVVDPHGVIIADASDGERVVTARLEKSVITDWRRDFPAVQEFLAR
jgi:omega-amidase